MVDFRNEYLESENIKKPGADDNSPQMRVFNLMEDKDKADFSLVISKIMSGDLELLDLHFERGVSDGKPYYYAFVSAYPIERPTRGMASRVEELFGPREFLPEDMSKYPEK